MDRQYNFLYIYRLECGCEQYNQHSGHKILDRDLGIFRECKPDYSGSQQE